MPTIAENLASLKATIAAEEALYHRPPNSVQLLAVTKNQPIQAILKAIAAGQKAFGENYLQEAVSKIQALADHQLEWHFIGTIQANKTSEIAQNFSWVHSIDRLKIAERLNAQRPLHMLPLNLCIQVNIDNEATKAGVRFEEIAPLAQRIIKLPNVKLRGLMAIPILRKTFAEQCKPFRALRMAFDELLSLGLDLDTLSMGMSADLSAAIAEGATILRIGTRIFGER